MFLIKIDPIIIVITEEITTQTNINVILSNLYTLKKKAIKLTNPPKLPTAKNMLKINTLKLVLLNNFTTVLKLSLFL